MTTSQNHAVQWQPAPSKHELAQGFVHLYLVNLDDLSSEKTACLSLDEKQRMNRYHFAKDQRRFASSRRALREILAGYLRCAPAEIGFETGSHGKPVLATPDSGLHFNLSHSDNYLLLAVSAGSEIGVDIEMIREDMEMEPLAEHYFSPDEQWEFRIARGSERVWKFFELWTASEARLKASGCGLGGKINPPDNRWTIQRLRIGGRFAAAIALENSRTQLECWTWPK